MGFPPLVSASVAAHMAYGMPDVLGRDRARYAGKTVAVLGAGHSAIGTLIDLVKLREAAPDTTVIWLLRGTDATKAFGGGANDKLSARGELGSAFARLVKRGRTPRRDRAFMSRTWVHGRSVCGSVQDRRAAAAMSSPMS